MIVGILHVLYSDLKGIDIQLYSCPKAQLRRAIVSIAIARVQVLPIAEAMVMARAASA